MVIQRLQSLYLLIATVLMGIYTFVPMADVIGQNGHFALSAISLKEIGTSTGFANPSYMWAFGGLSILITLLSLLTIFQFKKLRLQMNLCIINILLTIVLVSSLVLVALKIQPDAESTYVSFLITNVLPFCSVILNIMAFNGIRKDKKTLSSYDRIR